MKHVMLPLHWLDALCTPVVDAWLLDDDRFAVHREVIGQGFMQTKMWRVTHVDSGRALPRKVVFGKSCKEAVAQAEEFLDWVDDNGFDERFDIPGNLDDVDKAWRERK